jgi:hypothetical protein
VTAFGRGSRATDVLAGQKVDRSARTVPGAVPEAGFPVSVTLA